MTSEHIRQRSDLLGTQVITRDRGKRLGVVSQLWVDVDRREIVAIGLKDNFLAVAGLPKYMYLNRVCEIGDVILVDDERVLEDDVDIEGYSDLINSEVITETGEPLGRVRGFRFDTRDGRLESLIIASLGFPQIPDQVISTYELSIDAIVSSGPNRLIVFEGSEDQLQQLTVGVLERLGLGEAPWEKEEEGMYYPPTVKPANQLGTGVTQAAPQQQYRTPEPVEEAWEEQETWEEPIAAPVVQQPEPVYDDYEDDNWGDAEPDEYEEAEYVPVEPPRQERLYAREYEYEYEDDVESDAWADDETPRPYKAPRVNIPEKKKMPEYEEETGGY
ncbi:PRC-barrel domain-containing protein [Lyngbya sp. CCY1209]|uniref:PRC-barrel domain-containing protein n=1 Tax=Lyngbya sp. CCY1209 TaxID=2886103 RepID=UPI002D20933B|nr:PRC-barrel domain-containing protein [Lyngbya sp. CCY1209]MEB3882335.1 PRC-barrel domain-containing protein [Lyngbya sp. CCY1209]